MASLKLTSSIVLLGLVLATASVAARRIPARVNEENVFLEPVDEEMARSLSSLITIQPKPGHETSVKVKRVYIPYPIREDHHHHHGGHHHHDEPHNHHKPQNPFYPGYPTLPGYPGYPSNPFYPGYPGYPSYPQYPHYPHYPHYPPHNHSASPPHHHHPHYPHHPHRPDYYSFSNAHNHDGYYGGSPSFVIINPSNVSPFNQTIGLRIPDGPTQPIIKPPVINPPVINPPVINPPVINPGPKRGVEILEYDDDADIITDYGRSNLNEESSFSEPEQAVAVEYEIAPIEEDSAEKARIGQARTNLLQAIMKPHRNRGTQERFAQIYLRNYNSKK